MCITMKKNIKNKSNTQNKKIVSHTKLEVKNNRKFNIKNIFNNSIWITIFLMVTLITMASCLIISIIKLNDKPTYVDTKPEEIIDEDNGLFSTWISSNDEIWSFNSDMTFYYEVNDLDSYIGEFELNIGIDALNDMGYTIDEFVITFGEDIDYNNVYSLRLSPKKYYNGKEYPDWWMIFILNDDGSAMAYNKTEDIRYNLTKKKEI